jgi:hypothetical protein
MIGPLVEIIAQVHRLLTEPLDASKQPFSTFKKVAPKLVAEVFVRHIFISPKKQKRNFIKNKKQK